MMTRPDGSSALALSGIAMFSPTPVVGQSNPSSSEEPMTQRATRIEAQMQIMVDARRKQ
jgi:hypothetical protein